MHIKEDTVDDLLNRILSKLLAKRPSISPSRGDASEIFGILLHISNPRARLSRTEQRGRIFSCLGELLWYLSGSKSLKHVEYYIPNYGKDNTEDGKTIYGGYGPRLFSMRGVNQVENVVEVLKKGAHSRRAVIQLFDAEDISKRRVEVPCTCTLQFAIRGKRLHMLTSMRSNDALIGLPHDVFAFTMIQELLARTLSVEVGEYKHAVGSLHLYKKDFGKAQGYLAEGWQEQVTMPAMPIGDPWPSLRKLLRLEAHIRLRGSTPIDVSTFDSYWGDLARLLQIFSLSKRGEGRKIPSVRKQMTSRVYDSYIHRRRQLASMKHLPEQSDFFEKLR